MKIEIYGFPHSPFCIAVESALKSLAVEFTSWPIPAWDRSEILRLTDGHYYEVPLLVHDGRPVYESAADTQDIARHIDAKFGGGRLFPATTCGLQEIVIDYLESKVEEVTFKLFDPTYIERISDIAYRGMLVRHKERKYGRGCLDQWRAERHLLDAEAGRLLAPIAAMLGQSGAFLFGPEPQFADFLLAGILGNITFDGINPLPTDLPQLKEFLDRINDFRFDET